MMDIESNMTPLMIKIIDGMQLVKTRLIAYKLKMKSEIVISRNGKVIFLKSEEISDLD